MERTWTCQIEEFGRVVLPGEARRELGWEFQDILTAYVEGDTLVLKLPENYSRRDFLFCGADELI